jgi:hypothetical protein
MNSNRTRITSKLLLLPLITLLLPFAGASELGLRSMHLPIYIEFATGLKGDDIHKTPTPVTVLSRGAQPESKIHFLNSPYIPHHDALWKKKPDTNLISMCEVKIGYVQIENKQAPQAFAIEVRIDASAFKKPEDIMMTDAEVMELIEKTVALNFPDSKVVTLTSKP